MTVLFFQHFEKQNQNMDFPKLLKWVDLKNNRFVNPNPATGERGSYIPAETLNALVEENINAITALGGTPTENTNNQIATLLQKGSPHEAGLILRSPDLYGHRAGEYSIDVHTSAAELLNPNSSQHKQAIKNYVLPSEFNDVPFFLFTDAHRQLLQFYVGNLNNIVDSNETATLRLYCFYSCPSTKTASLVLKNKTGAALSAATTHQQLLYTQNGRDFYKGTAIYKCPTSASRASDLSLEITMPSSRTDPDFVTAVSVEIVPTGTQADDRFINGGVLAALSEADQDLLTRITNEATTRQNTDTAVESRIKTTTGVNNGSSIAAKSGSITNQNRTIEQHLTEICDSTNNTINNSFSGMKTYADQADWHFVATGDSTNRSGSNPYNDSETIGSYAFPTGYSDFMIHVSGSVTTNANLYAELFLYDGTWKGTGYYFYDVDRGGYVDAAVTMCKRLPSATRWKIYLSDRGDTGGQRGWTFTWIIWGKK